MVRQDFAQLDSVDTLSILSNDSGAIHLPDGVSAFQSDLGREGRDLIVTDATGGRVRIVDYFVGAPADLIGSNGGVLPGATVARLAGPEAPGLIAQDGNAPAQLPIGQVEALTGVVTAQRADGTMVTLQIGSKVFEDDVVSTSDGATASLTFVDGTIFTMASASRMILDELIYDPDSTSNSAAFNLIEGGFVFIAGQVAGTGGMDVTTPTATMGIRGTTVSVDIQTKDGITTVQVSLNVDPDGGIGRIELRDLDGNLLSTIESTDIAWIVSPREGETREIARVLNDDAPQFQLLSEALAAFQSAVSRVEDGGTFVELDAVGPSERGGSEPEPDGESPGAFDTETEDLNEDSGALPPTAPIRTETTTGTPRERTAVTERNTAPEADDLLVSGLEDTVANGQMAGIDANGDPISYSLGTAPSNGSVVLRSDGSFDYTPNTDFSGTDRFAIVLSDGKGGTSTAEVVIDVRDVNDAPRINDAGLTTTEDNAITDRIVSSDPDGETPSVRLASGAANGGVVVLSDGTFTYTPNADFNGLDSFLVDAVDAAGVATRAKIQINVSAVDDAPEVAGDTSGTYQDTGALGGQVTGTVTAIDPDAGASATWSGNAAGAYGSFVINPVTGAWTYRIQDFSGAAGAAAFGFDASDALPTRTGPIRNLKAGESAVDRFTVTALDNTGEAGSKVIEITVIGTNDVPQITGTFTGEVSDGSEVLTAQGNLFASDPDTDATATWSGDATGTYGSFAINSSGRWTYTLSDTDADTRALKEGESQTERFTVTVQDDQDESSARIVEITVTGTNDAPSVTAIDLGVVLETDDPVVLNLLQGQSDIDADTISAVDVGVSDDTGATVAFEISANNQITIDPAAYASLNTGESRTITVEYAVFDGTEKTPNTAVFRIDGITDNTAPSATDDVLKARASKILIVATNANEAAQAEDGLDALNRFSVIDALSQTTGLTAVALATYDAVLTFSNRAYENSDAYGDLLAGFVTEGGGVVAATYSFSDGMVKSDSLPDGTIGGAFEDLSPFAGTTDLDLPVGDLRAVVAADEIWDDVDVDDLADSYSPNDNYPLTTLNEGATLLARYGTGETGMLGIARNEDGTVIGANIFPGNADEGDANFWTLFGNMLDNVTSRNQPEFTEDTVTTIEASRLLANDTDGDGDTLTITGVATASTNGAALSLVDGNIVYDPTGSVVLNALKDGQSLTDTFTYTVSDTKGGSSVATVTLTVAGADEPGVMDLTNGVADQKLLYLSEILAFPDTGDTELESLMNPLDIPASGEDILTILGDDPSVGDAIYLMDDVVQLPDQVTLTDGTVLDLYSYTSGWPNSYVEAVVGIDQDIDVILGGGVS